MICQVKECERQRVAKGMCLMHYKREWRKGGPGRGGRRWQTCISTGKASYNTMHKQIVRRRGSAKTQSCDHCGEQAQDWAYNHNSPFERTQLIDGYLIPYSVRVVDYIPLCKSCHRKFDVSVKSA